MDPDVLSPKKEQDYEEWWGLIIVPEDARSGVGVGLKEGGCPCVYELLAKVLPL